MSRKVLLIGWDAGDWNVVKPMVDAGKMPTLKRLMDDGVWGNLATIRPVLSPMLWTSIATGKRAWKHGIHGFSEPCPSTGGIRPITNLSRKTKAVWNIFNQQGWKSNVIGWWPSSPAEPINGVMVSNHFQQAVANVDQDWPLRSGTIHPERLVDPLKKCRVHPAELTNEHILPFIPRAAEIDQEQDRRMESCAKVIAETAGIHAAATACIQLEPWDFMAVYYDGIDHFGHGFMKFHPPQQDWIDEKDYELYKGVIEMGYRYHDMMLDTMLQLAGDDVTVMLISDHGFEPGKLRPKNLPNEPAGPAAEHGPYGMFCLKGPGIRQGERVHGASLLDITPTLLHLKGLAVGRDMDGKVLVNCFEDEQQVEFIDSWDDIVGDDGRHPLGTQLDVVESRESLKQLIDLGYIDEPNPDQGRAVDETVRELQYNLSQAYMDGNRYGDAAQILSKLWDRWPDLSRFGVKLLSCYIAQGNAEQARTQLSLLADRKKIACKRANEQLEAYLEKRDKLQESDKAEAEAKGEVYVPRAQTKAELNMVRRMQAQAGFNPHAFAYFEGSVCILEKRYEEAIQVLERAKSVQAANRPSLYSKIAEAYIGLKDWSGAQKCYEQVLEIQPISHEARAGLAKVFFEQGFYFQACGEALASLELIFHNPYAHSIYGISLSYLGKPKMAEQALRTAISQNPGCALAHRGLARLYDGPLKDVEMAKQHRILADEYAEKAKDLRMKPLVTEENSDVLVDFPKINEKRWNLKSSAGAEPLIVVSGLPRSGTSLMMQMLEAAGVDLVSDSVRGADDSNPKGYYEDERVKGLLAPNDRGWLYECVGRGLKIVAPLVQFIPQELPTKIIFMQRSAEEVLGSQRKMLDRDGKIGANSTSGSLSKVYAEHLACFNQWIEQNELIEVLPVDFSDAVEAPIQTAKRVAEFLGVDADVERMASVSQQELYRERA